MICFFKKTFLKDLASLPAIYRRKIEKLVFEDIPGLKNMEDKLDVKKIEGYVNYYRIRIVDTLLNKFRRFSDNGSLKPVR